jgi:hypothetical protein
MITISQIRSLNNLHNLPKNIHVNQNILLDYRLFDALKATEKDPRNRIYDFDVYLEKYKINLQRDYVWEHFQQNEYIFSILFEKPLEPVIIVQHSFDYLNREDTINYVIDGKQRLMTIQKFIRNEFPIIVDGNEVYFKDFDPDLKHFFEMRVNYITAVVYYSYPDIPVTDDMKIWIFNFYNFSGTPQTEKHKNMLQSLLK